jgi:hypothetical protein
MKTIGIAGGGALCELGSTADVQLFFGCIERYVVSQYPERNWALITDRLYRRYLRMSDVENATVLMSQVQQEFAKLPNTAVDWKELLVDVSQSRLDPNKNNLAEVFEKYFDSFFHCVDSSKINYEGFKSFPNYQYEPVRFVVADLPWFMVEKKRPLDQYDELAGKPFWLQ